MMKQSQTKHTKDLCDVFVSFVMSVLVMCSAFAADNLSFCIIWQNKLSHVALQGFKTVCKDAADDITFDSSQIRFCLALYSFESSTQCFRALSFLISASDVVSVQLLFRFTSLHQVPFLSHRVLSFWWHWAFSS